MRDQVVSEDIREGDDLHPSVFFCCKERCMVARVPSACAPQASSGFIGPFVVVLLYAYFYLREVLPGCEKFVRSCCMLFASCRRFPQATVAFFVLALLHASCWLVA